MDDVPSYFRYWGKAKAKDESGIQYHLLPYHCLDVAAVAEVWWNQSRAVRHAFTTSFEQEARQVKAWVLFFVALHDYGKWDLRFQRKAPEAWKAANPKLYSTNLPLSKQQIRDYFHGPQGLAWLYEDCSERFLVDDWLSDDNEDWGRWLPWMSAVAGHHGEIPINHEIETLPIACRSVEGEFKSSRLAWLNCLEQLFLSPVGLSLKSNPPPFKIEKQRTTKDEFIMLAGFCSVSDWLGSSDFFPYDAHPQKSVQELALWYQSRFEFAERALKSAGIISQVKSKPTIRKLLEGYSPRQVQCLMGDLPVRQSLTLIEASTGSGKTEAALAYAWQLLEEGLADSIVFALPTQATANAMLGRLEKAASIMYGEQSNLVLAHGRARYHQDFIDLKLACKPRTAQGKDEAWVQCGEWLAQSRKRVFLGQIGVCTVDQVLISVLPVRHKFVRGFGIGRSVLIVDEVHAYDSYMYGLLAGVLEQQHRAGGSVILLSATLPTYQKQQLAKAWGCTLQVAEQEKYPLISHCVSDIVTTYDLCHLPDQMPVIEAVHIELLESSAVLPSVDLLRRIEEAVVQGAQVCLVCNLVDVAQELFQKLAAQFEKNSDLHTDQISLFHSRLTFRDRQAKEQSVFNTFGKNPIPQSARDTGHLLVATQVVEQSLDIDFDWLITQLCPVDLLFQRMGRLHRHQRPRPSGFDKKLCTVLAPDSLDYQLHALIYGNSRVLWRTHELLKKAIIDGTASIQFPDAYRSWIEVVYQESEWLDEPECIRLSFEKFELEQEAARLNAKRLIKSHMNTLTDDDSRINALTRDGEMSLTVVPFYFNQQGQRTLIDGETTEGTDGFSFEEIDLNSVAVPASWARKKGTLPEFDVHSFIWLEGVKNKNTWFSKYGSMNYSYSSHTGFQRQDSIEKESL